MGSRPPCCSANPVFAGIGDFPRGGLSFLFPGRSADFLFCAYGKQRRTIEVFGNTIVIWVDLKSTATIPTSFAASPTRAGSELAAHCPSSAMDSERKNDFATLYRTTVAPLRRYLARLLGNTSEAQDVAHDAYLKVYPLEQRNIAHPEAFLYTTARRLAINRLKRRSISPISPECPPLETAVAQTPGVENQVMARQEADLLKEAIAGLPEGCRTVLLLRKLEQLSHKEIAERLEISVSTVEKQHARALRLLRSALQDLLEERGEKTLIEKESGT